MFYGRNGIDTLNKVLVVIAVILYAGSVVAPTLAIYRTIRTVAALLGALFIFRTISRNLESRQRENELFLSIFRVGQRGSGFTSRLQHKMKQKKEYKIFVCPNCGLKLRVPKGRGNVEIICSQCKAKFRKRT